MPSVHPLMDPFHRPKRLASSEQRLFHYIQREVQETTCGKHHNKGVAQTEVKCWGNLPVALIAKIIKLSSPKRLRLLNRHWRSSVDSSVQHLGVTGVPQLLPLIDRKFTFLKSLTVRHLFASEDLRHVVRCKNLTTLDLHWLTTIQDESLKHLSTLTNLTNLNLERCERVSDAGLECVCRLTKLRSLSLGWTQVSDEGLKHLSQLVGLKGLDLRHCRNLTDEGLKEFAPLTNLTNLNLEHCAIEGDVSLQYVGRLFGLRMLGLNSTLVRDESLVHISNLPNLRELYLDWTFVGDDGVQHLLLLSNLRKLSLQSARVSLQGAGCLSVLTNLVDLNVRNSHMLDHGAQQNQRNQMATGFRMFFSF